LVVADSSHSFSFHEVALTLFLLGDEDFDGDLELFLHVVALVLNVVAMVLLLFFCPVKLVYI
jgi:hypothetical protein